MYWGKWSTLFRANLGLCAFLPETVSIVVINKYKHEKISVFERIINKLLICCSGASITFLILIFEKNNTFFIHFILHNTKCGWCAPSSNGSDSDNRTHICERDPTLQKGRILQFQLQLHG